MTPAHAEVEKSTRSVVGNDLMVLWDNDYTAFFTRRKG
jgi:hypothetical protein